MSKHQKLQNLSLLRNLSQAAENTSRYPQTLANVCLEIYNISLPVPTQFGNCETYKLHGRYDNGWYGSKFVSQTQVFNKDSSEIAERETQDLQLQRFKEHHWPNHAQADETP